MAELIAIITNIALTLSFVVALVFGIAQVKTAARDRKECFTLETIRTFQTHEFAELLHFVNSHPLPDTQEAMRALPANEQVNFIHFAQEMESLGILVAEKLINIDLVDKTLGSFVTSSWEKYKTVFNDI